MTELEKNTPVINSSETSQSLKRNVGDSKGCSEIPLKRSCGDLTKPILLGSSSTNDDSTSQPKINQNSELNHHLIPKADTPNDYYFKGYSNINIHRDMIADHVRTMTYRRAILKNYDLIRGKVVADVGAGTGILSVFCVHAGAKKVYAVEASQIAEQAKLVVAENKMEEKITVIHGKVEEVDLPEKVDIIVSEWMGYSLLYESMLSTVLEARDKWLKPGGSMLPSSASIYIAPYSDIDSYSADITFWDTINEQYKVNMSSLKPYAKKCLTQCPHVQVVQVEDIMSREDLVCTLDLERMRKDELQQITGTFNVSCFGHSQLTSFILWFSVAFPGDVVLSTSPYDESTHWAQSIFYVNEPQDAKQDSIIKGKVMFRPSQVHQRFLEVEICYQVDNRKSLSQQFIMDDMSS